MHMTARLKIPEILREKTDDKMTRSILILTILTAVFMLHLTDLNAAEPPKSLPDVRSWRTATYDESFFQGRTLCGEEALTFMWQSINWRS
ncbi:uncharacterized protein METZ01_LOCUS327536, partial [marine metagenome]